MTDRKRSDALEKAIGEWQESLFRFAFYRTGSLADAQDIVQNVFLKLYDSSIDLSTVSSVRSYLYRSVANASLNYHRNKRPTVAPESVALQAEDNDDGWIGEYERISGLLDSLPAEQAEVIRMRCIAGLAFAEIAEVIDIPVTTAKSRFKYGIDKLKSKIRRDIL